MKALRQLGFLKVSLRPEAKPDEDHRVLELFRNRAELKKAYGGLQDETYRLKDLIKQQEGATQRVQDLLSTLEGKLGTPEAGYPALVFYQLRRLWQAGRELIKVFVADLVRQQEERERRAHLAQHNRQQFARRQAAEAELAAAKNVHLDADAQLAALRQQRERLTRVWHYFKRRALEQRIAAAEASFAGAHATLAQGRAAVEAIEHEAVPEFPGLSLPARRAININAIAYAEVLCLRIAPLPVPLVAMARDAIAQREATDDYGTPQECVILMGHIARAHMQIAEPTGLAAEIAGRTERLKRLAKYRSERDSTPLPDSLAFSAGDILASDALGPSAAAQLPNVLGEDTWDLFRILLR
jgi:hypothetical protein